ncbi:hypothetical protein KA977_00680 [Candidatus Dependentiae bacterium]|nr:hypothetical protein [Candidatus Dependentiae bacterium]
MNGTWTGTAHITAQEDSITAKVTDQFGRTYYDTITVNYYYQSIVKVVSPLNNSDTKTKTIFISGTTNKSFIGDTVAIYINEMLQSVYTLNTNNGTFIGSAVLTGYNDIIKVVINPIMPNLLSSQDTTVISYFDMPVIEITDPAVTLYDTSINYLTISGTSLNVQKNDTIQLFVNNILVNSINMTSLNSNWSGSVSLNGYYDSVVVKLTDQFGRNYYDTVTINYLSSPLIYISYPTSTECDTNNSLITIRGFTGFTRSGDTVELYVEQIGHPYKQGTTNIISDSGSWSFNGINLNSYNDTVFVVITDKFGRTSNCSVVINYIGIPSIRITTPINLYDTFVKNIIISGTTFNAVSNDTVEIFINGILNDTKYSITKFKDNFSIQINLNDTINVITAKLINSFNSIAYDTITVNYYPDLSVKIKYPTTSDSIDYDTYIRIITLSGTSNNSRQGDTIEVFVNGYYQIVPDTYILLNRNGNWECDLVPLLDGNNKLTIKLTDGFGRIAYDTITLQYFDSGNVSIQIAYPVNNSDTYITGIQIRGTTYNTRSGDIIYLTVNGKDTASYILSSDSGSFDTYINLTHIANVKLGPFTYSFDTTVNNVVAYIYSGQGFYDGKFKYSRVTVNYFGNPTLAITSPSKTVIIDTDASIVQISGTTKYNHTGDTVMLYVNNLFVPQIMTNVVNIGMNGIWTGAVSISNYADSVIVKFIDRYGQTSYDTVQVNFYKYPKLAITSPLSNYDTSFKNIIISGTTEFTRIGDTVELFVNGVYQSKFNLTDLNGIWAETVVLSNFGDSIVAKLTDRFGRIIYDTIIVNYYGGVSIAVTNPIEFIQFGGYDTNVKIINISGTLSNAGAGDIIKIYTGNVLNYTEVLTGVSNVFSGTASLTSQQNTVYAVINDRFGLNRFDTYSLTVHYFDNPSVSIIEPVDNYETAVQMINVSGTSYNSNNGDTIEIFIRYYNGDTLSLCSVSNINSMNGTWSGTVSLAGAGDSIVVKFTDKFGVSRYNTSIIKYLGYSIISIKSPCDNVIDTFSNSIMFSGTSFNSVTGDSIFVYRMNNESDTINSDSVFLTKFILSSDTEWSGILNGKLEPGKNILLLQLKPKVANCSYDTIVIYYLPDIDVKIIMPEDNTDTCLTNIIISGTSLNINGNDTIELFVNGIKQNFVNLNSYNENWSLTCNISGLNDKINVALTDKFGRIDYDTITLNYLDLPVVSITSPVQDNYYETNVSTIAISGTTVSVRENDFAVIYLNGILYSDSKDVINNRYSDNWLINNIKINSGFNTIVLQLTDNFNRTAFDTIIIYYYPELDVVINNPVNSGLNYDTYNSSINISGFTKSTGNGDTTYIYVNGNLAGSSVLNSIDGSFTLNAFLSSQSNTISILVKDRFGRYDTDYITINYFDNPYIEIVSPVDLHDTSSEYIMISGTSYDVNTGDKIEFYVNSFKQSEYVLNNINGNWSGTVKLTGLGDSVAVKLVDKFNRIKFDTIMVNYIKLVDVDIFYPNDNICTNVNLIKISGISYNSFAGDTVKLFVNGIYLTSENIQIKNGGFEFNDINLSSGNNYLTAQLISKFNGLTDYDTIIIKYNDSVNIKFLYPITSSVSKYDTNSITLLLKGSSSADNGNTVTIYVNNNYKSSVILNDNQWNSEIQLSYNLLVKTENVLIVKIIDEYTNVSYDTITVYCDLDNPPVVDSGTITKVIDAISEKPIITFKWSKPDMSDELYGDDFKQYNIFRLTENEALPIYLGSTTSANFTDDTAQYEKNYVYYIQMEDNATNKSDMTQSSLIVTKIYSTDNIPQLKVWTQTNSGTTSVFVNLISYEGSIISCFDGNTVTLNSSKLNFVDSSVAITNGVAEFKLNSAIDTMTKVSINFQNKIFETQLFMKKSKLPPFPPITFVSETYLKSYAMIVIPYEIFYMYFMNVDPNLKVKLEKSLSFSSTIKAQIAQANETIRKLTHFVPLSTITNLVETTKGFNFEKSDGTKLTNFDSNYIQLYISYPDDDNDLIVDGTISPLFKGMPVTSLNFYWLNENSNQWEIVTNSVNDPINKLVSVRINHFSIYSVFGANISLNLGLGNVKVYPNPFKPNSGIGHNNVIFDNVQPGTRLRIFTVTGQIISENTTGQNQYRFIWDGKNDHGQSVASGVYIYMLEKGEEKKIGKILVIK